MEIQKVIEVLYHFGEAFILSFASLIYLGIKPPKKKLFLFSLFFGLFVITIRMFLFPALHIPDIYYVIVFLISNIFFLAIIFNLTFFGAIICNLLYFITIIIFENITFILFKLFGLNPSVIKESLIYLNTFRWLNFLFISLLVFIFLKSKFILIPIKKSLRVERNGD